MTYIETGENYTYFEKKEEKVIENWLKKHGYSWERNTVCGSCCGMFEDVYWVNGIGGKLKKGDGKKLVKFLEENKISAEFDNTYHITAI